jgi:hypothetical protein
MKKTFDHKNIFHKYTSVLMLALIAVAVSYLFWNLMLPRMDFYNELWGPAYLLVHGQSPYDTTNLNPILPAVWLPMAIGLFFPLGLVPENLALQIWFIFNVIEICVIVYFAQGNKRFLYNTVLLALLCFFSPFVLNHFNLGQFSITAMLCLMLSTYSSEKQWNWLAAFFLALGLSKPQLGIIAVFGLSVLYFQRNGIKGVLYFGSQTFLMALLMSLPLFISYPAWIPDWFRSMQSNYTWLHPSLFSILSRFMGVWGIFIWVAILMLSLAVTHQLWMKFPPLVAMMWSLGITTIVTPYIWSWDFVLLLPIWIYTFAQVDWKRKTLLLILYVIAWFGMAQVQALKGSSNDYFWWVPLWFVGAVVLVTNWKLKREEKF